MRSLGVLTLLISLLMSSAFAASAQTDLEGRRKALNDLLAEQWEYTLRNSPIYASILGDKRWNDKLDDFSQKAIEDDLHGLGVRHVVIPRKGKPGKARQTAGRRPALRRAVK